MTVGPAASQFSTHYSRKNIFDWVWDIYHPSRNISDSGWDLANEA